MHMNAAGYQFAAVVGKETLRARVYGCACLVAIVIAGVFAAAWWRAADRNAHYEPYVVSVFPDGHTEGQRFGAFQSGISEKTISFFARDFTIKHYSRLVGFTDKYYHLSILFFPKAAADALRYEQERTSEVADFLSGKSTADAVDIQVSLVELRKIDAQPIETAVHFRKIFKSRLTGAVTKPEERWVLQLHFKTEPTRESADVNPLGFQIVYQHLDKEFASS
ncbi:MAG: VirB8/TrbF family protein [Acidobacteriota bacterium]